jgi:dolichol-phosphate mannosyltransferase
VLPLYQTGVYLHALYQRTCAALEPLTPAFELLMIDDGSRDNAWEIVTELSARDPRVKGLKLSRNFGQHPAICAGFEHARGDAVVLMDADLQDRPEDIPRLLERLTGDVDIVYTVKETPGDSLVTRLTSRLYHYTFSRLTRTPVPENIGTFRAFTRRVLEALLCYPERNVLYGPLMFHLGFRAEVVQVLHDPRTGGRSAYSFRKRLTLALDSLINYTNLPHRLLLSGGATLAIGCFLYSVLIVGKYLLLGGTAPPGLTLLALLGTFSLGSMMASMGIIGTYVFRVYQEVLRRPRYLIARSVNLEAGRKYL